MSTEANSALARSVPNPPPNARHGNRLGPYRADYEPPAEVDRPQPRDLGQGIARDDDGLLKLAVEKPDQVGDASSRLQSRPSRRSTYQRESFSSRTIIRRNDDPHTRGRGRASSPGAWAKFESGMSVRITSAHSVPVPAWLGEPAFGPARLVGAPNADDYLQHCRCALRSDRPKQPRINQLRCVGPRRASPKHSTTSVITCGSWPRSGQR